MKFYKKNINKLLSYKYHCYMYCCSSPQGSFVVNSVVLPPFPQSYLATSLPFPPLSLYPLLHVFHSCKTCPERLCLVCSCCVWVLLVLYPTSVVPRSFCCCTHLRKRQNAVPLTISTASVIAIDFVVIVAQNAKVEVNVIVINYFSTVIATTLMPISKCAYNTTASNLYNDRNLRDILYRFIFIHVYQ